MSKKKRQITDLQFKAGILVAILLIVGLFYFAFIQERFVVKQDNLEEALLVKDHLSYETEFCANKLTELTHEAHFLQKISTEKTVLGEELVPKQDAEVIIIEQRELQEINEEFNSYKLMCDQFDENPTAELCTIFLEDAKSYFELAQKNADETTGIEHFEILIKELRNSKRIYEGLQEVCVNK